MPEVLEVPVAKASEKAEMPTAEMRLLIECEPWSQVFRRNIRDLCGEIFVSLNKKRSQTPRQESAPGVFWPDVFVERPLPWRRLLESGGYHVVALLAMIAGSRFLVLQPHAVSRSQFTHADVVYYSAAEYLPPVDTRRPSARRGRRADPELSRQPVISVPREADNRSQTVVAAPRVRLKRDMALPNSVAFSEGPRIPIAPAPLAPAAEITRLAPQWQRQVIAPPPELPNQARSRTRGPEQTIVAPPPAMDAASNRRAGDLNIAASAVIGPAPQLALDAQRSLPPRSSLRGNAERVIGPPPSLGGAGGSRSGGAALALSLHPAVGAPPAAAAGNRRGTFAATPEGHRGASGAPGSSGANAGGADSGHGSDSTLPSGLYVGGGSANQVNPNLMANVRPPHMERSAQPGSAGSISAAEREVFGSRKIYSLSLNMPNLNSAGGSWIIRFADLNPESAPGRPSGEAVQDLSSPVATRKVDPAYPLELMRQNVQGTVILYGVIHSDGTVGGVRVLRSVDERLDRFAREAIAKWKFQPAMKNGSPVDVEATFWIPFRPAKVRSAF